MTWQSFARLHDIPEYAVVKAIKEQKVWPEQGYWKARGVVVKAAFDVSQDTWLLHILGER